MRHATFFGLFPIALIALCCGNLLAQGSFRPVSSIQDSEETENQIPTLPETVVEAEVESDESTATPQATNQPASSAPITSSRATDLIGQSMSASEGYFGAVDLEFRPINRAGDVLELIPGMIATQHSGTGKANQYFIRGINLDHGTDFALRVDGVPINLPSHGHGQGYLDINWVIPELIEEAEYKLGPYYADVGDFSSAGSLDVRLRDSLPHGIASFTLGEFDYYRTLIANSSQVGRGTLLYAFEGAKYDGPWLVAEDLDRYNGMLRWSIGDEIEHFSFSAQGYKSDWTATNQVSSRAVQAGLVDRFGSLNPTDAGESSRVGLNAEYVRDDGTWLTQANTYINYYDLNLFSDFTYFLDDPVNGDQIQQIDNRIYTGLNLSQTLRTEYTDHTLGFQFRNDNIFELGLNRTNQRQLVSTVRSDDVDQQNYSLYYTNETALTSWARSYTGLRGDFYRFHTHSKVNPADSGTTQAEVFSPKLGLVFGPWYDSEIFLNWGQSFHSNDSRGVNAAVDPADPLVKSDGSEIGARTWLTPTWNSSLTYWYLEIDSELVFVGDAGTTEPGPPSHRSGATWTNQWALTDYFSLDADYSHVKPRFMGGERIPNAVENVLSTGFTLRQPDGPWYSTFRLRHYGPAALIEDNSARSSTTTVANAQLGYDTRRFNCALDVFNLFDSDDNDITYFYESQPLGLAAAEDFHFHPVEPLMARLSMTWKF